MSTSSTASSASGFGFGPVADLAAIPASVLKNKLSEVARLAARAPLAVTRHNRREFVILTADHYEQLQKSRGASLESLATELDGLITRMNTPKAKRATAALFAATPMALSGAAAKARKRARHAS